MIVKKEIKFFHNGIEYTIPEGFIVEESQNGLLNKVKSFLARTDEQKAINFYKSKFKKLMK